MTIKDMPHTTVDQVIRLHEAAIQLEAENEKLQAQVAMYESLPVVAYLKQSSISGEKTLGFDDVSQSQSITPLICKPKSTSDWIAQHDQQVRDEAYERAALLVEEYFDEHEPWIRPDTIRNLKGTKP